MPTEERAIELHLEEIGVDPFQAEAFSAYLENFWGGLMVWDATEDHVSQFEDAYQGEYDSLEDYAWQLIDDCYDIDLQKLAGMGLRVEIDEIAWSQDYTWSDGFVFSNH